MLSVVTSTRNRPECVTRLGTSLHFNGKMEWILMEASDEPVMFVPGAQVIRSWPPEGATKSLNIAFRKAQGKYVMLLACDVEPYPDTLDRAVKYMESHPTVGQGALYFRQLSGPGKCHISPWHGWMYANFFIIRREVGDLVGWFEPTCKHYAVDNDLSAKVLDAGWGVVGIPGACLKDHDPKDESYQSNNRQYMGDSQKIIEPKWAPHQERLARVWKEKWAMMSGPYECANPEHQYK